MHRCGDIHPPSEFLISYAVDEVLYTEDLTQWIDTALQVEGNLLLLEGVNSDSGKILFLSRFQNANENTIHKLVKVLYSSIHSLNMHLFHFFLGEFHIRRFKSRE